MEGNSRAGPSSEPTTVPLSPGASSSSRVHDDNVSSCGSVESEDEGYEELYAELKSAESKGKGVDRNFMAPRAETETSRPRAQDAPSKSGSWSDLNLSLVVALVSPIGNWLTGSDHIKNLFLIAFLIFYLHQLIEVPWKLYHASRPRKPTNRSRKSSDKPDDTDRVAQLAASELRAREVFFLTLTVASPLGGAYLVRYILATLEGVDNLSWFSTALFVLATGIRPWSHLIERLNKRTQDLHDAIHYPSEDSHVYQQGQVDQRLDRVFERLDTLDLAITELKSKVSSMGPLREVCDDLSEALGDVERNLLRHDRKIESVRVSHDTHLATLESSLLQLEERHRRDRDILEDHAILLPHGRQVSGYIQTALCYVTQLSRKAYNVILPYIPFDISLKPSAPSGLVRHSVDVSLDPPCRNGSNKSPVLFTTRLETIPEAEDSDSDGTYVSGEEVPVETSPTRQLKTTLKRSRSISPLRRGATSIGGFVYSVAVWPYHVATRLFWLFFAPVQKILL